MIKRIVIAGCRDYNNYDEAKEYINFCISRIKNEYTLVFLSGGCRGADAIGERYAKENGFKIELYPADWNKYGKSADRNETNKWQRRATMLFAFGMKKAREQNQ